MQGPDSVTEGGAHLQGPGGAPSLYRPVSPARGASRPERLLWTPGQTETRRRSAASSLGLPRPCTGPLPPTPRLPAAAKLSSRMEGAASPAAAGNPAGGRASPGERPAAGPGAGSPDPARLRSPCAAGRLNQVRRPASLAGLRTVRRR